MRYARFRLDPAQDASIALQGGEIERMLFHFEPDEATAIRVLLQGLKPLPSGRLALRVCTILKKQTVDHVERFLTAEELGQSV